MEVERETSLHATIANLIPHFKARVDQIKRHHSHVQLRPHTVQNIISGSRSIKSILWDISMLDADKGILYRGVSIHECFSSMGEKASPEGILWLFLTTQMPSSAQITDLSAHLRARGRTLPQFVFRCIDSLPEESHPLAQLVCGIMALQSRSKFAEAYSSGSLPVSGLWEPALEDCLDLIARLPILAAYIYRRAKNKPTLELEANLGGGGDGKGSLEHEQLSHDLETESGGSEPSRNIEQNSELGKDGFEPNLDQEYDLASMFCHMLGFDDPKMCDMMRMYMVIHSDHEGGAASSHAVRLVGSTLSDPYLAFASGMNACAGPLHGLAIQESFKWIKQVSEQVEGGMNATKESLEAYVRRSLEAGHIIPGFGHALMKGTDPRYECLYKFCEANFPEDPYFRLLSKLGEVVPHVMKMQGKVRNPWPNVDAIIGVVFNHFGLNDERFFPVILGVTRSIGALSQLVWDRALCLPIERPSSVTLDWIERYCEDNSEKERCES